MSSLLIRTFVAQCDDSGEKTAITLYVDKQKGLSISENVYDLSTGRNTRHIRTKSRIVSFNRALRIYNTRSKVLKDRGCKNFEHSDSEAAFAARLDFPGL